MASTTGTKGESAKKAPVVAALDYSVKSALDSMLLSTDFKTFAKDNRALWSTFGKMDSHQYRKKFMKLVEAHKLTKESILAVHFFFSIVKKKSRVLDGLDGLPEDVKKKSWFEPTRNFIATAIVDYNTGAKTADKFPGTHIPTCNPGLDLFLWRLSTPKEERTLEAFFARTTSVQMNLNAAMQAKAKAGYKEYWDNVVKGTKNAVKTEEAKYREEYYLTSAGDTYSLVEENGAGEMKEVTAPANGYSEEDLKNWMLNVD